VAGTWATAGLDLHVDARRSRRRASLEESLRLAIQQGRLAAGTRLPSSRTLAGDLELSRGTVAAAYDQLIAEGYLLARQGAGTQVADLADASSAQAQVPHMRGGTTPRLDLRPGVPDIGAFPVPMWLRWARKALNDAPTEAYGYGSRGGRNELRSLLVDYLGRTRGVLARPEQIIVTTGSTQSVSLLSAALASTGVTTVAMEDPCFGYHRDVARWGGQCVVPLPVDGHGAVTESLGTGALSGAGAAIVTPAHQYPTGVTLHPARRQALTAWARETGGLVIEDDYDGEFRYDRQPIGAVQGTAPEHVAYLGTTSKALGPGLRLGWAVLPHQLVEPVKNAKLYTDHSTNGITQLTMAECIASHGYDRQIRQSRQRYRRRRDALVAALEPLAPCLGRPLVTGVPAGLQALVRLPDDGPSDDEVVELAAAEGLALEGLGRHWHSPGPHPQGLIVGFCRPSERTYPAAVALLTRVLRRALPAARA